MKDETRAALSDKTTWMRLPVMLLFFLLLQVATPLLIVVSLVAWFIRLFTGRQPQGVIEFGEMIGEWFGQTADYLCGGARRRPFPFEDHDCPSDRAADQGSSSQSSAPRSGQASETKTQAKANPSTSEGSVPKTAPEKPSIAEPNPKTLKKSTAKKPTGKKSTSKKATSRRSTTKKSAKKSGQKSTKKTGVEKGASGKTAKKTVSKKISKKTALSPADGADEPANSND